MTSVAKVMSNLTSVILTEVKNAVSDIPLVGKLFDKEVKDVELTTPKVENTLESEAQTDDGKMLGEVVKPVQVSNEDNSLNQVKQNEMMDKQNKIFEQMLNRLAPQTTIAFN